MDPIRRLPPELFPHEWLDTIIAIDSETHHSNTALIQWLRPLVEACGLKVQLQTVREGSQYFHNLIAFTHTPDHPEALVLNTHLDTVSAGDANAWTETQAKPLEATWVGDKVYGLGTADVKLDFLCKLWALKHTPQPTRPTVLVGTYGEERGLVGVRALFDAKVVQPRYALVGEPSELHLVYAHKGHVIATATFELEPLQAGQAPALGQWTGRAAHSSTPALGENALVKAVQAIRAKNEGLISLTAGTNTNRIPESATAQTVPKAGPSTQALWAFMDAVEECARPLQAEQDPRFSPAQTTLSWNLAERVDSRLELSFDVRTLPHRDPAAVADTLRGLLPPGAKWKSLDVDPPLKGSQDSVLVRKAAQALQTVGVNPIVETKASSTEAAIYNRGGAQAVVFGPGVSIGNVHKPNEHCLGSHLVLATRFYRHFLQTPWEGAG